MQIVQLPVEQFHAYLDDNEAATADDETAASMKIDTRDNSDLFHLFTELAALKNEVRLESRQLKLVYDLGGGLFDVSVVKMESVSQ